MGTFRFVEMVCVITFTLAVLVNIMVQRRRGVRAVVLQPGDLGESLGMIGTLAWFGAVYVHGLGVAPWLFGPRLLAGETLELAASALCIGGVVIGLSAYLTMGRSWRIGIDHESDEELVTSGIFGLSRNPIYVFVDLFAIATALGTGTVFFLVTAPVVLVGVHAQIRKEEEFLRDVHGETFEQYCHEVGRYVGNP